MNHPDYYKYKKYKSKYQELLEIKKQLMENNILTQDGGLTLVKQDISQKEIDIKELNETLKKIEAGKSSIEKEKLSISATERTLIRTRNINELINDKDIYDNLLIRAIIKRSINDLADNKFNINELRKFINNNDEKKGKNIALYDAINMKRGYDIIKFIGDNTYDGKIKINTSKNVKNGISALELAFTNYDVINSDVISYLVRRNGLEESSNFLISSGKVNEFLDKNKNTILHYLLTNLAEEDDQKYIEQLKIRKRVLYNLLSKNAAIRDNDMYFNAILLAITLNNMSSKLRQRFKPDNNISNVMAEGQKKEFFKIKLDIIAKLIKHDKKNQNSKSATGEKYKKKDHISRLKDYNILHYAIIYENLDLVKYLLEIDNPNLYNTLITDTHYNNLTDKVEKTIYDGLSPLHLLLFKLMNTLDVNTRTTMIGLIREVINKEDVTINIKERNYGNTPLHLAVLADTEEIVGAILEKSKESLLIDNNDNITPLELAIRNINVIKILYEKLGKKQMQIAKKYLKDESKTPGTIADITREFLSDVDDVSKIIKSKLDSKENKQATQKEVTPKKDNKEEEKLEKDNQEEEKPEKDNQEEKPKETSTGILSNLKQKFMDKLKDNQEVQEKEEKPEKDNQEEKPKEKSTGFFSNLKKMAIKKLSE
jgi:ankyrin repeat protein